MTNKLLDQIKEAYQMLTDGILTDEEFSEIKHKFITSEEASISAEYNIHNTPVKPTAIPKKIQRDYTTYKFNGREYNKSRLVLAVVKSYVKGNNIASLETIQTIFPADLQGSLGVVRLLDDVSTQYVDYLRRFYTPETNQIQTDQGPAVVCTQWGKGNIEKFIEKANQLGCNITNMEDNNE